MVIILDNGLEFHADSLKIGIELRYSGLQTRNMKGEIERINRTVSWREDKGNPSTSYVITDSNGGATWE